ncbi:MAG: hypothetical protein JW904_01010 [Spirochaetales bacterium]|nr:hypothetical protein [Spirochaetales bacterium]
MNKRIVKLILAAAVFSLFAVPALSAEENGFIFRLSRELKAYGWNDEETGKFVIASHLMNWNALENGDAEMVALALHYCKQKQLRLMAEEQVQLAYHLGAMGVEMEALGFKRRNITITALGVSEQVAEKLRDRKNADNETGTGDMIRERIRDELCKEGLEEQQEKIMERLTKRVREGAGSQHRYAGAGH